MRILQLSAENIKRLSVVDITPPEALVVLGGVNGAGKSSVLDAIEMALAGAASAPEKPVRAGQPRGKVRLDLGDIIVTRTFTAAGGTELVVSNKEGARFPSPQAMLDKLRGKLGFDPQAFERMEPKRQRETLQALVGLDVSDLDAEATTAYQDRALLNKTVRHLEGHLAGMPEYPEAPTDEVSFVELTKELEAAERLTETHEKAKRVWASTMREYSHADNALGDVLRDLEIARQRVRELEASYVAQSERVAKKAEAMEQARVAGAAAADAVVDTSAIRARITAADEINIQVRANRARAQMLDSLETERTAARTLTNRLANLEVTRQSRLADVTFPLPGLGFDENGITMHGLPFEQASQAERLRASIAIGLKLNPTLKVLLVRDGSALDRASMAILLEMATEAGGQIWVETVKEEGDTKGVTVVISDGTATLVDVPEAVSVGTATP